MYDLVAPIDRDRALLYLERLRLIAGALLANRDDHRSIPPTNRPPIDSFRQRAMEAWGGVTADRNGRWNTDVVTSGMFVYPMAAFARRVGDNPALQTKCRSPIVSPEPIVASKTVRPEDLSRRRPVAIENSRSPHDTNPATASRNNPEFQLWTICSAAVRFTTAALETYKAFLPEQHFTSSDPHAYFTQPRLYAALDCKGNHACEGYRDTAGKPLAYNENLSMMKALAETALAANSQLYRSSTDATPSNLALATKFAPQLIAKNVLYFKDAVTFYRDGAATLAIWNHQEPLKPHVQDTAHGGFELESLAVIFEDQDRLNDLLSARKTQCAYHIEQVILYSHRQYFLAQDLEVRLPKCVRVAKRAWRDPRRSGKEQMD
jgi:hypothetical protein